MSVASAESGTAKPEQSDAVVPTPQQHAATHIPMQTHDLSPRGAPRDPGEHSNRPLAAAVGTIDAGSAAPSSMMLVFDGPQAKKRLVGKAVWFEFEQDGVDNVVFGQITSIGAAGGDAATGAYMCRGAMAIGVTFAKSSPAYVPSTFGTMPAAGTPVFEADDALIGEIIGGQEDASHIGKFYGSNAVFPVSLPPFAASGTSPYNIGIYGARGSGKMALARTLIAAFAKSPASSILAIDPDGSLAGRGGGEDAEGGLLGSMCRNAGKRFHSYSVGDLVLDRWDLFHDVLRESDMLRTLLPDTDRREVFMGTVRAKFRTGGKYPMAKLRERGAYDSMMELLCDGGVQEEIYPDEKHVRSILAKRIESWRHKAYETHWLPMAELFNPEGRKRVSGVVRHACEAGKNRPVMVVNLSKKSAPDNMLWNDGVRAIVARRIMREIAAQGEDRYGSGGRLDALAVICGAESMAPRRIPADWRLAKLRDAAVDLARSSREYA